MPLKTKSTLLFDLDGTLLDSFPGIKASMAHAVAAHRQDLDLTEDAVGQVVDQMLLRVGVPLEDIMLETAGQDQQLATQLVQTYRSHNHSIVPDMPLFAGCIEILKKLRESGRTLGIVTSKSEHATRLSVESHDLEQYFSVIIARDHTQNHKPHPEPLQKAMQILNKEPGETAYVGDSVFDMEAARAAGCLEIAALWGAHDRNKLLGTSPALKLENLEELLDRL